MVQYKELQSDRLVRLRCFYIVFQGGILWKTLFVSTQGQWWFSNLKSPVQAPLPPSWHWAKHLTLKLLIKIYSLFYEEQQNASALTLFKKYSVVG